MMALPAHTTDAGPEEFRDRCLMYVRVVERYLAQLAPFIPLERVPVDMFGGARFAAASAREILVQGFEFGGNA